MVVNTTEHNQDTHVELEWGLKGLINEPMGQADNIIELFRMLSLRQWLTFCASFMGWALDAMEYFTVSLALSEIAHDFGVPNSDVAATITLTLAMRPVGALLFGIAGDMYGRRIPLIVDVLMFATLGLAAGFTSNLTQFTALRTIFGIAMGGEWGLGSSLAMESLPPKCRGLFSGILQQGYAFGNLMATALYYLIVPTLGWRALFWISACPAFLAIFIRVLVPESESFESVDKRRKASGNTAWGGMFADTTAILKQHWFLFVYCILMMSCFNFLSHGSQDLQPTFLKSQLLYSATDATISNLIGSFGAICGGMIMGYFGQYIGRRRAVLIACVGVGAMVYPWAFTKSMPGLRASVFLMQFFVQGAWGQVPAHLAELSPRAARGLFAGMSYQLGNLVSSASAQIEAAIGEKNPTTTSTGVSVPNYAMTQAILIGIIAVLLFVVVALGPENRKAIVNVKDIGEGKTSEIHEDIPLEKNMA